MQILPIIKQLSIVLVSFASVLFAGELFITNAKISDVSFAEFYDDIGKGLASPGTFIYFNEGFGIISTNSSRFIGKNVSQEKKENVIRIALLGDSYVESIQVFERHNFGNIIQRNLNDMLHGQNINVEVMNFGRSSFNIGNMYAYQRLLADTFNPDYVLYFLSNDDLKCNYSPSLLFPTTTIENNHLKTSLTISKKDLNIYQKTKLLTQQSTLANILNNDLKKIQNGETFPTLLDKFYPKQYQANTDLEVTDLSQYKLDLISLNIINALDTNAIIISKEKNPLPLEIQNLCASNNLKYWELASTFDSLENSGIEYNKWSATNKTGHWNQYTHKAIGEEITSKLFQLIKIPKAKTEFK